MKFDFDNKLKYAGKQYSFFNIFTDFFKSSQNTLYGFEDYYLCFLRYIEGLYKM